MSVEDFRTSKPQTRDLSQYFDSLADWVHTHIEPLGKSRLTRLEPTSEGANGFVGESFIIEVEHDDGGAAQKKKRYLLKRKPTGYRYFPDHDFAAEYLTQEFLSNSKLAVAEFIGYDTGSDVLGSPFYIIAFVEGNPTPDKPSQYHSGWLKESSADMQRAVCRAGVRAMAMLHSKTIEELGLSFLKRAVDGQTDLDWELAKWDRFSDVAWLDDKPLAVAREARQWLEDNKPAADYSVISWGDARPGNMLFDAGQCNAIIDWDMVGANQPEKDLGYWLHMDLNFQRFAENLGDSELPGWPSRTEMVDIYQEALGRDIDCKRLRYHRIFSGWQSVCMFSRFNRTLNKENYHQFVNEEVGPPLQALREGLDLADQPGDVN